MGFNDQFAVLLRFGSWLFSLIAGARWLCRRRMLRCLGLPRLYGRQLRNARIKHSVRPVSAHARWSWSPNGCRFNRRFLVSDCHIPECICRMARPIMFWAQTDTALLDLTLVIVAERSIRVRDRDGERSDCRI
jgi:hypothetical protein